MANRTAARRWLIATIVLALGTAGFGWYIAQHYLETPKELTVAQSIQLAIARLFIFSVLYFATVWCGRNFKAHKHNELVTRHRQHALRTFEAFLNAATDPATKNAVLLQSTTAIFAASNTGFAGADGEGPQQPHIIEMVKTISGKSDTR